MTTLEELKIVLENGREEEQMELLSHLQDVFESYKEDIQNFEEIMDTLIKYAIKKKEGEVTEEILYTITTAETYQNVDMIDFSAFAENINKVSDNVLLKYIEILSYTYDLRYIPYILKFRNSRDEIIGDAVEEALLELRYEG